MGRFVWRTGVLSAAALLGVALGLLLVAHGSAGRFPTLMAVLLALCVFGAGLYLLEPAWIIAIGVSASIFSGDFGYLHLHAPLDRVVLIAGLLSFAIRTRRDRHLPRVQIRSLHWCMALMLLYTLASSSLAGTLGVHAASFALLDQVGVVPFILFLVAPAAFSTSRQRRILLGSFVVIGAYLGLTAIFEVIGPHALIFPSFINNPALGVNYGRAQGPLLESGADGLTMFVSLTAAVTLVPGAPRRLRLALFVVILLCGLGIFLTETRQVWIGAGAGSLVAMATSRSLRRYIPLLLLVTAVVVGVALLSDPTLRTALQGRTADASSVWDRLNSDAAALRMVEQRPLWGFGWGSYATVGFNFYHLGGAIPLTSVPEIHNVPLSFAAELGLLGLVWWVGLMVTAVLTSLRGPAPTEEARRWRTLLIAVVVAWFVQSNFEPLTYAFDNYVVWLFAGLTYAVVREERSTVPQRLAPMAEVSLT